MKTLNLFPTRWINISRNDEIGYQSLSVAAAVIPLLIASPVFYFDAALAWLAWAIFSLLTLCLAAGVVLQTARSGMCSYQSSIEERPTGVSVTHWHKYLYEHPLVEYFVFHLASRVFYFAWLAIGVAAVYYLMKRSQIPAVEHLRIELIAAALAGLMLLNLRAGQMLRAAVFLSCSCAIGVAFYFEMPAAALAAYIPIGCCIAGWFEKMKGDAPTGQDAESAGEIPTITGPAFSYFVVTGGLLATAFNEGGMYRRARDVVSLATVAEMSARADADQFQPVVGQVHRGGRLAGAELAAKLKELGE